MTKQIMSLATRTATIIIMAAVVVGVHHRIRGTTQMSTASDSTINSQSGLDSYSPGEYLLAQDEKNNWTVLVVLGHAQVKQVLVLDGHSVVVDAGPKEHPELIVPRSADPFGHRFEREQFLEIGVISSVASDTDEAKRIIARYSGTQMQTIHILTPQQFRQLSKLAIFRMR